MSAYANFISLFVKTLCINRELPNLNHTRNPDEDKPVQVFIPLRIQNL